MGSVGGFIDKYGNQAKSVGAIVGMVAVIGGGGKWIYDKLAALEITVVNVQSNGSHIEKLQKRVDVLEKQIPASERTQEQALRAVVDSTRDRFLVDERVAAEMRGTIVALITEVRVRHGQPGYVVMPSMALTTYNDDGGGDSDRARTRAQIEQNKAASEALNKSLDRTIEAIPHKAPLADLIF